MKYNTHYCLYRCVIDQNLRSINVHQDTTYKTYNDASEIGYTPLHASTSIMTSYGGFAMTCKNHFY
jgi:hypothetical protein